LNLGFANEHPVRQRAVDFFRELPEPTRSTPLCATAYGYMQSKRGNLGEAERSFVQARPSPFTTAGLNHKAAISDSGY
jgi:hypothetical protein